MKVGDLVMLKVHPEGGLNRTGIVVDVVQKKCWRTHKRGHRVNFSEVNPEPHGTVLFENKLLTLPATDLKVVK